MTERLGDAPIQAEYLEVMNAVARALDRTFNGEPGAAEKKVGFILQEPFLFTGTIRDNVLYGNEPYQSYTNDQIVALLAEKNLASLLVRFEHGLDTKVTLRSGGFGVKESQQEFKDALSELGFLEMNSAEVRGAVFTVPVSTSDIEWITPSPWRSQPIGSNPEPGPRTVRLAVDSTPPPRPSTPPHCHGPTSWAPPIPPHSPRTPLPPRPPHRRLQQQARRG